MNARKVLVEKITARVFCDGPGGGNPLTVFASSSALPTSVQRDLARTCQWESVMVNRGASAAGTAGTVATATSSNGEGIDGGAMTFFLPSGEEVSFCAHAAVGGAVGVASVVHSRGSTAPRASTAAAAAASSTTTTTTTTWKYRAPMTGDTFRVDVTLTESTSGRHPQSKERPSGTACLHMTTDFVETALSPDGVTSLRRTLQEHLSVPVEKVCRSGSSNFTNASVARPKTLVRLTSVEAVHNARAPSVGTDVTDDVDGTSSSSFATACDAADKSTGIYLYAPRPPSLSSEEEANDNDVTVSSWECRQFPRASGYAEDPATGIAAAALAASLQLGTGTDGNPSTTFHMYQGTAMGRPSLIQVVNLLHHEATTTMSPGMTSSCVSRTTNVSFGLRGYVEIDDCCSVSVG